MVRMRSHALQRPRSRTRVGRVPLPVAHHPRAHRFAVYHMVGGFRLSSADYFHHLLFVPLCGVPGQLFQWGAISNFQAVFISGLPGGIDYLLLGLQKISRRSSVSKFADKMYEKRFNANLNTWLRGPGVLLGTAFLYQAIVYEKHQGVPLWAVLIQTILPPFNACYYSKQAIANFAVHHMLHVLGKEKLVSKIGERTSVTTGEQVLQWHAAYAVPQRGS